MKLSCEVCWTYTAISIPFKVRSSYAFILKLLVALIIIIIEIKRSVVTFPLEKLNVNVHCFCTVTHLLFTLDLWVSFFPVAKVFESAMFKSVGCRQLLSKQCD